MEIIINDLNEKKSESIYKLINSYQQKAVIDKNILIINNNDNLKNCEGCFYCWTKTPGKCRIKDGYENLAELYSKADKVIIISKCCYGTYSPFIKNILDRSIPYLLPFFKFKNKEMHHMMRYKKRFALDVYFYGKDISNNEKNIAKNMVKANSINLNTINYNIYFLENIG